MSGAGSRKSKGRAKENELTSDGASDESILGRGYAVSGNVERGKEEVYEMGGIVRTVAVDVKVSER